MINNSFSYSTETSLKIRFTSSSLLLRLITLVVLLCLPDTTSSNRINESFLKTSQTSCQVLIFPNTFSLESKLRFINKSLNVIQN